MGGGDEEERLSFPPSLGLELLGQRSMINPLISCLWRDRLTTLLPTHLGLTMNARMSGLFAIIMSLAWCSSTMATVMVDAASSDARMVR